MRRHRQIVILGALLAVAFAACGTDEATPPTLSTVEFSEAGLAGRTLFETHCGMCHKNDLTGAVGPALDAGSEAAAKAIETLRLRIIEGGNGMPTWGGRLEAGEIDDLVVFLREIQGR